MPRCGACNKKFDKAKDLMRHIRSNCKVADAVLKVVDSIVPEAEGRGVIGFGTGDLDLKKINERNDQK